MTNHLITLQQIRDKSPCREGWTKLLKTLGNPSDLSMQVSFGDIAKSNGAQDALWCLRCIDDRRFAVSLIMPAVKRASKHTTNKRAHDCIEALERWLSGGDTVGLKAAVECVAVRGYTAAAFAAYAAAYAAYTANAANAANAADRVANAANAANAAYAYAADRADRAAARAIELKHQIDDIIKLSPLHAVKAKDTSDG